MGRTIFGRTPAGKKRERLAGEQHNVPVRRKLTSNFERFERYLRRRRIAWNKTQGQGEVSSRHLLQQLRRLSLKPWP